MLSNNDIRVEWCSNVGTVRSLRPGAPEARGQRGQLSPCPRKNCQIRLFSYCFAPKLLLLPPPPCITSGALAQDISQTASFLWRNSTANMNCPTVQKSRSWTDWFCGWVPRGCRKVQRASWCSAWVSPATSTRLRIEYWWEMGTDFPWRRRTYFSRGKTILIFYFMFSCHFITENCSTIECWELNKARVDEHEPRARIMSIKMIWPWWQTMSLSWLIPVYPVFEKWRKTITQLRNLKIQEISSKLLGFLLYPTLPFLPPPSLSLFNFWPHPWESGFWEVGTRQRQVRKWIFKMSVSQCVQIEVGRLGSGPTLQSM